MKKHLVGIVEHKPGLCSWGKNYKQGLCLCSPAHLGFVNVSDETTCQEDFKIIITMINFYNHSNLTFLFPSFYLLISTIIEQSGWNWLGVSIKKKKHSWFCLLALIGTAMVVQETFFFVENADAMTDAQVFFLFFFFF